MFRIIGETHFDFMGGRKVALFVSLALIAAGIGLYVWKTFFPEKAIVTILGVCGIAAVMIIGEIFFSKAQIRTLAAISFGLLMGYILSIVLQPVVELIVNGIVGLNFSCDGSHYLDCNEFLLKLDEIAC